MRYKTLVMCLLTFLLLSCGGKQQAQTVKKQERVLAFQLPEVPVMLQRAEDRLKYVVEHYWDHFNFKDTAYIHAPDVTEQALVNYIDLLARVPMEMADTCLTKTIRRSMQESKMEEYITELFHRYLMDPNSPLRYEELYEPIARLLSTHPDLVKSTKAQHDLRLIHLNRRGTVANDFVYTLYGGMQHRLHQLKANYTILLFYNPDCETCAEVLRQMKQSALLNEWLTGKQVKLLAVYPEEEYKLWEAYRSQVPENWINAYDKEHKLLYEELYDLKAMPSLYLLNSKKEVLLKDVFWGQIEEYLKNNSF